MSVDAMTSNPRTVRRSVALLLALLASAAALYFVFRKVDEHTLRRLVETQDRGLLLAAVILIMLQIVAAAERWRMILSSLTRGRTPSGLSVQAVFYASIFFNSLPLGTVGGDVARVWLARTFSLSLSQLTMSVLIDRMLAVAAVVLLAVVSLPAVAHPLAPTAWIIGVAAIAGGIAAFLLLGLVERAFGRWRHRMPVYLLLRAAEELLHLRRAGGVSGLCYALLSAIASALAGYCIARSLAINITPLAMIAIMSIVTLVSALPISFAGWGIREVSMVTLLGLLGVNQDSALLTSLEFGLLSTLLSLPGGVVFLILRHRREADSH